MPFAKSTVRKKTGFSFRMPDDLREQLEEISIRQGRSVAALIIRLLDVSVELEKVARKKRVSIEELANELSGKPV
ncbi:MAG: Arc family DNA-binding protein [Desulfobacter sp.]